MPLNNNFFVEGIDPTATFGGFASVLLQLVRQATPSSTYGMVLFDSSPPYVLAPYEWRKRCVWINTTNINLPTLWVYREGGSPGWYDVTASIPASSITSAMLQNSIVTLAKLSASGAAANQLIQVNATATGFQFVNPSSLFATPSTIPLSAIIATPVSPATYGIPVSYGGAAATWELPVDLATFFPDQSFTVAQLLRSPTVSTIAKFPRSSTASPVVVWGPLVPATDIVDNGVNGLKITDDTLPVTKIIPHTVDGYYLTTTLGVATWTVIPTPPVAATYETFTIRRPSAIAFPSSATVQNAFQGSLAADIDTSIGWNSATAKYTTKSTGYFRFTIVLNAYGGPTGGPYSASISLVKNNITIVSSLEVDLILNTVKGPSPIVIDCIDISSVANVNLYEAMITNVISSGTIAVGIGSTFSVQKIAPL
jgi:hypothetical protein